MRPSAGLILRQRDACNAPDIEAFIACHGEDARLAGRTGPGSAVIDHERVECMPGGEPFKPAAGDPLRAGKMARIDFARGA